MKKILVVLMIFAVAGGVFAQQGTWGISSKAQIGSRINFDPDPMHDGDPALVRGSMWERPYGGWSSINGELGLSYNRGPIGVGLTFNTGDGNIVGTVDGKADNYTFQVSSDLNQFLAIRNVNGYESGNIPSFSIGDAFVNRLWGSYNILNNLVLLEVAYRSRDTTFWVSDQTGAIGADYSTFTYDITRKDNGDYKVLKAPVNRGYRVVSDNLHNYTPDGTNGGTFSTRDVFSKVDKRNYVLGQVETGGLQLGLMVPNVFATAFTTTTAGSTPAFNRYSSNALLDPPFYGIDNARYQQGINFVDETFGQAILGAKFNMSPLEVAAQIKFQDFGVYFGGRFFAGPITIGMSFMGTMGKVGLNMNSTGGPQYQYAQNGGPFDTATPTQVEYRTVVDGSVIKIGGRVDYNGGSFGANLKGFWGRQGGKGGEYNRTAGSDKFGEKQDIAGYDGNGKDFYYTVIGIEPMFFINAIPSYLRFQIDAGFYFETYTAPSYTDSSKSIDETGTYWALQPQLSWNFRGDGPKSGYGTFTGMMFRYRIVSNTVNALDLAFLFNL